MATVGIVAFKFHFAVILRIRSTMLNGAIGVRRIGGGRQRVELMLMNGREISRHEASDTTYVSGAVQTRIWNFATKQAAGGRNSPRLA